MVLTHYNSDFLPLNLDGDSAPQNFYKNNVLLRQNASFNLLRNHNNGNNSNNNNNNNNSNSFNNNNNNYEPSRNQPQLLSSNGYYGYVSPQMRAATTQDEEMCVDEVQENESFVVVDAKRKRFLEENNAWTQDNGATKRFRFTTDESNGKLMIFYKN